VNLIAQKRFLSFTLKQFTVAELAAVVVLLFALFIAVFEPAWTFVPLLSFVVFCFFAPFIPRFGFFLPVISRGFTGQRAVALTFDDGPDPMTTPMLLDLLETYNVAATFFVIGERARAYPHLIKKILQAGHTLGNHSFSHDSLVMFKGGKRIEREIIAAQQTIQQFGLTPLIFRPPAGITYPGLGKILKRFNLQVVNFSCRAFDRGNRSIAHLSKRILKSVKADDIIVLHDTAPPQSERCAEWLVQMEDIIVGLKERGFIIKPLADLISKPIFDSAKDHKRKLFTKVAKEP
jgi:peptidoglycan/xylan/chitin deacetylase (PgdA/CDA1 family)